jgi:hypothetical protein
MYVTIGRNGKYDEIIFIWLTMKDALYCIRVVDIGVLIYELGQT